MSPVTTVIPTRTLLSTEAKDRTPQSTEAIGMGNGSVTPSRSTSRLPPRFTPSPERRHSSFQRLLRIHLNTFNQRLSMLESNTLDMKESIHSIQDQQSRLTSQLKELIVVQSAGEKNKKVGELEKGHTDMESRLSRLEGRLEILIDGFTALAQEMNKMKRARHVSRSPQERRALPSLATVLELPFYSTPPPPVRLIPTETPLTSRATVAKSIPTPGLPANKRTSAPKGGRPRTASRIKPKTTLEPETKRPEGRRSAVTVKPVSQPSKTRSKKVKEAATITQFQLEPPPHKSTSARVPQLHKQSDQANKKPSTPPIKNNGRDKAFRSDAPVPKKVQERGKSSKGDSKNPSKPQNEKKLVSQKTRNSAKDTVSTTKPTRSTSTRKSKTTVRRRTPAKTKVTAAKKKVTTAAKRTSNPSKTKTTTTAKKGAKKTQKKKKTNSQSGVLDLLRLLKGGQKSTKHKTNQDGSLHVVLGRLAIPIKIIPDD